MFDNRHCGAGVPSVTNVPLPPLPPAVGDLVPAALLQNIIQFAFAGQNGGGPAVPCRLQGWRASRCSRNAASRAASDVSSA